MNTVLFSGLATTALLLTSTSVAASDSSPLGGKAGTSKVMRQIANGHNGGGMPNMGGAPGMGMPHVNMPKPGIPPMMGGPRPGMPPMMHGPRPGYNGIPHSDIYRRPYRGFAMPRYWAQPNFYIPNYTIYGLSAPSRGYNWSRYYDDAVLLDGRGYVQDFRSGVDWNAGYAPQGGYREPEYGPAMRPDQQAYDWGDNGNVAFASPDGSSYSYDGEWDGNYVDPQGRVFEGEWEGTVTRHDGVSSPSYPAGPRHAGVQRQAGAPYPGGPAYEEAYDDYRVPQGYEDYERCLKSNGLTGGAIGAILGGVAGNRIAGRGDRLGGTLLGAGLGGLAGVAIEKATGKCKRQLPRYQEQARAPYPQQGYYPQQSQGWQGGYYYYPQSPVVTTVTIVPGTSTTTTVTEEVYYETVRTAPRKHVVRKWKPKPRCTCR